CTQEKMLQRYGSLSGKLQMIELEKDPAAHGLGISLTGNKDGSRARMGVYVADIDALGPAGLDGRIQIGDELLEINGQILYGRSHQNASAIISNAPCKVKIILIRIVASLSSSSSSSLPLPASLSSPRSLTPVSSLSLPVASSSSSSLKPMQTSPVEQSDWPGSAPTTSDPVSCPIVAGKETTIEIYKGNVGLGLSIVGGCDTLLGAVIIHEVNDGGAAQRDGRLQAGDQILEVNGIDMRQASHDEAIAVLRLTTQRVQLCVFRHQESYREEDLWDVFSLELRPRPGEGLGFTTVGKSNDTGIFVSDIIRGGVADSDGRLLLGDQILSINGEDVRAASQERAQTLLQNCSGGVHLEVARFKAGVQYTLRSQVNYSDCSTLTPSSVCDASFGHQRETDNKIGSYSECQLSSRVSSELQCRGPYDSLGISVAGGVGSPHGNLPLFIATMDTNGLAAKTQKLQVGSDHIIAVNGHCLEGVSHAEAVDILKKTKGTVVLTRRYSSSPEDLECPLGEAFCGMSNWQETPRVDAGHTREILCLRWLR
uniref:PDZ domain-containing protein n=1 Tax=Oreochromis niloticus TaxID=8128 RepID=I3JQI2_ORENI